MKQTRHGSAANCGLSVAGSSEKLDTRILMCWSPHFYILVTSSQLVKHLGLSNTCVCTGWIHHMVLMVQFPECEPLQAPPTTGSSLEGWQVMGTDSLTLMWPLSCLLGCQLSLFKNVYLLGFWLFFPNDRCTYLLYTSFFFKRMKKKILLPRHLYSRQHTKFFPNLFDNGCIIWIIMKFSMQFTPCTSTRLSEAPFHFIHISSKTL